MSRIGELIGAALLGGLTVAGMAFGVSRVSAQEASAATAQYAEVEAAAFAGGSGSMMMQAAMPSIDEMAAGAGGGCGIDLDPEFAAALRDASQAAVADALGMTVEELEAAREAGQDVRQLAEEKGIELETVHAAVEAARQTVIEQGVADGTITQEQADFLLEHPRPGRGPGGGPQIDVDPEVHERIRSAVQAAVAETLGMTVEELEAAHEAGTDLRELAEAAGVEPEALREATESARIAAIDQAVADGLLTAEEAEQLKAMPPVRPGRGGPHGGPHGGPGGGPQGGPNGNPNP